MNVENKPIRGWHLFIIALLLTAPLILLTLFSYQQINRNMTESTLARRQATALLTASLVKERLDHLKNVSVSFTTNADFRKLITQGKWNEAVEVLQSVPTDFQSIERIFIVNASGILMADTPALPGVRGQHFALRDWYVGAKASGQPYVSEVYKRAAKPQLNVVAISIPLFSAKEDLIAMVVMQISLDKFSEWCDTIKGDHAGLLTIVDQHGHGVSHPGCYQTEEIIDHSNDPGVRAVLNGESGVEIMLDADGEEEIVAYEPVTNYGWGVIIEQPTKEALVEQNINLSSIVLVYGIIIIVGYALSFYVSTTLPQGRKE